MRQPVRIGKFKCFALGAEYIKEQIRVERVSCMHFAMMSPERYPSSLVEC